MAARQNYSQPERRQSSKKISVKKAVMVTLCAILSIIVILSSVVFGVFWHYYSLMDISTDNEIHYNENVSFSDEERADVPQGSAEVPKGDIFYNKDVVNILLIGTDERTKDFNVDARADSMMLLSLNKTTSKISLVSLERGMLVNIPGREDDILTHTFRYGGANLLLETVRTHFKVDVEKYVRINFSMFQQIIDEIGGVDITLTDKEAYGLNTPNWNTWPLSREVSAGPNHFNGYEALQYARMRWIDSDFSRIKRQRTVIESIKGKISGMSVSELNSLAETCLPYVQTNLSTLDLADIVMKMPAFLQNDMKQMTVPQSGTFTSLGNVDFQKNSELLNEFLTTP